MGVSVLESGLVHRYGGLMTTCCFRTVRYKNGYVFTKYVDDILIVEAFYNYVTMPRKTITGAKRWITKQMRGEK
jgi:hypothetical protein